MESIVISIAKKISGYLVAPIGQQLGYLFQFTGNVETFTDEFEKLRTLKADVEPKVHAAEDNVKTISNEVKDWLNRVSLVEGKAQIIVEDKNRFPKGCLSGWLLNIKSRHGLSRRAKKITSDIVKLQQEGRFTEVSIPVPPKIFIGSTSTTSDSRELKLKEIIENLKDQKISMIGICGMGGVGKTTMVEEVFKRVKDENMFDDYAMTVVSQKPDMVKVQREIAEMLRLKLEESNPVLRASLLNQRLEGKKVLIILDDVWEEFDLKKNLGITLDDTKLFDFKKEFDRQGRCKIVFTSRTQGLWMKFQNTRELSLDPLPFIESWNLFKENIGVFLDDKPEFVPIAEHIVKECAGLPLALVTLGHALLGKSKHAWNDTLLKLGKISGVQQKVYESIRQSYDYLGDEEAKSLFLLSSLFEEDSRIYIESLVNMGMGLRLFKGINSVEEARDRVFTLVEHLQSRCLVSKKEAYITVHDVVRDVSKFIASTEKGSLVLEQGVTLEELLDQTSPEHCTRISIISNEITELPSQLRFPRLELLRSTNGDLDFPDSCFEGMIKLQVLDIICSTVLKLPSSLQSLTNLHTLCLHNYRLEDFTTITFLQSLEILRINDEHIEELPKEIGQLTKLRLLDMTDCTNLERISPGIISCLTVLEELYLGGLDINWGAEENEEGRIAAHKEFKSLSKLFILHIVIKDPCFVPLFKNLKKYKIQIGDNESFFSIESQNYERIISISGVALEKDFNFILHHSEALLLKGESTKSLVYELVRKASQSIKCLLISETDTPEYLVNTKAPFLVSTLESLTLGSLENLHQIINGPLVPGNFAKLKNLYATECKKLRNIFRLSNAVDVLHLESLDVNECESMEEVICWEGRKEEANRKLQFPNLKKLEIKSCKSLISFCKGAKEIEFHQLEVMTLGFILAVDSFFPRKVLFPKLVTMDLYNLTNMKEIVDGSLEAGSLVKLKELDVKNCNQLRNIFQLPTETDIVHLERLVIVGCESMEEVIKWEGREKDATNKLQFHKLSYLQIHDSAVICFCRGAKEIEFHQLYRLYLSDLPGVECLISSSNENHLKSMFPHKVLFPKLVRMNLFNLTNMKEIVDGPLEAGSFVKLEYLKVRTCNQLKNIFQLPTEIDTMHLEELVIEGCESMEEVIKWDGREEDATTKLHLPKLRQLNIVNSAVICFCRGAKEIEFRQLDRLELNLLPGVECLISSSNENPLKSMFPHKVLFPKLVKMCLWDLTNMKEIVEGPLKAGSFMKLKNLDVWKCNQLRNIFRLPTEIDIVHLEWLEIRDCESMEEVIKWEGREECANSMLHFPKLRELKIQRSGDICFCRGAKEIEFHQLDHLYLNNLRGVECLISGSNENPLKSMFPHKVLFSKLLRMHLYNLTNMKEIVDGPLEAGSFVKLQKLIVRSCRQLRNIFQLPTEIDIVHLERLEIVDCESMEEVIKWEGREEYATSKLHFPKLSRLEIQESGVICFCRGAKEIEFHQLDRLELSDLPAVECLISSSNENTLKSMFSHKVLFPRMEIMILKSMPNVKEIWCGQPQAGSFCNLVKLYIKRCDSLEYVFSPCMPRYLVYLQTLYISNCRSLKEVVAAEKDKDVEEEYSTSILSKLRSVTLKGLPTLGRFCHIVNDLEFPVLDDVSVANCPEFKTFAPGYVHTPNLSGVKLVYGRKIWKENLNNTVQHIYDETLHCLGL